MHALSVQQIARADAYSRALAARPFCSRCGERVETYTITEAEALDLGFGGFRDRGAQIYATSPGGRELPLGAALCCGCDGGVAA